MSAVVVVLFVARIASSFFLFLLSPLFWSHSPTPLPLQPHSHAPAGLQGQGEVDGKARGAEEDAARGEKKEDSFDRRASTALSSCRESRPPDSQRSRRRESIEETEQEVFLQDTLLQK